MRDETSKRLRSRAERHLHPHTRRDHHRKRCWEAEQRLRGAAVPRAERRCCAQGVGFAGPLLLEKVPGRTLAEIDENFRLAKEFVVAVAQRTAAGPSL